MPRKYMRTGSIANEETRKHKSRYNGAIRLKWAGFSSPYWKEVKPKRKYEAINHKHKYSISVMCKFLGNRYILGNTAQLTANAFAKRRLRLTRRLLASFSSSCTTFA